jgi:hypothetical protein
VPDDIVVGSRAEGVGAAGEDGGGAEATAAGAGAGAGGGGAIVGAGAGAGVAGAVVALEVGVPAPELVVPDRAGARPVVLHAHTATSEETMSTRGSVRIVISF